MFVTAVPTGTVHEFLWNTAVNVALNYTTAFSCVSSKDVSLWGAWSPAFPYRLDMTDDSTTTAFRRLVPEIRPRSSGDQRPRPRDRERDGTGIDNSTSTSPTSTRPTRRPAWSSRRPPAAAGLRLDWQGGIWATQYLEARRPGRHRRAMDGDLHQPAADGDQHEHHRRRGDQPHPHLPDQAGR